MCKKAGTLLPRKEQEERSKLDLQKMPTISLHSNRAVEPTRSSQCSFKHFPNANKLVVHMKRVFVASTQLIAAL
jgi:hypothetical protein